MTVKICPGCHYPRIKEIDFYWHSKAKGTYQSRCKTCCTAANYSKPRTKKQPALFKYCKNCQELILVNTRQRHCPKCFSLRSLDRAEARERMGLNDEPSRRL